MRVCSNIKTYNILKYLQYFAITFYLTSSRYLPLAVSDRIDRCIFIFFNFILFSSIYGIYVFYNIFFKKQEKETYIFIEWHVSPWIIYNNRRMNTSADVLNAKLSCWILFKPVLGVGGSLHLPLPPVNRLNLI